MTTDIVSTKDMKILTYVANRQVLVNKEALDAYCAWLAASGTTQANIERITAALILSECREWRKEGRIA